MAIVGKALRQKWADDAHEARHPERVTERIAYRRAAEQALAETSARFPVLTAENFEEANRFRETRTQEILNSN
jgi:hypothetical protein